MTTVKVLKTASNGRIWSLQALPDGLDGLVGNDIGGVPLWKVSFVGAKR